MSLFSKMEQKLRDTIEGLFRQGFRGEIQPIEIANALIAEMVNHRRVSVGKTYVPNHFLVKLNAADFERISPLRKTIQMDLVEHVAARARQEGWSFVSDPEVVIEAGELEVGEVKVLSSFVEQDEAPSTTGPTQAHSLNHYTDPPLWEAPERQTRVYSTVDGVTDAEIIVISGPQRGSRYRLTPPAVLGRGSDSDLVFNDSNVSRRHLRIEKQGRKWVFRDLNSTNGTFVNDSPRTSGELKSGDEIRMGTTVIRFQTRE